MKTILIFFLILFSCSMVASFALGFDPSFGPGEQTVDKLIYTGSCYITGILIITNGTDDAKVILYDNTSASGDVRWEQTVIGGDNYGGRSWTYPKKFYNGIYVDVSGTGASYIIEYIKTDR